MLWNSRTLTVTTNMFSIALWDSFCPIQVRLQFLGGYAVPLRSPLGPVPALLTAPAWFFRVADGRVRYFDGPLFFCCVCLQVHQV